MGNEKILLNEFFRLKIYEITFATVEGKKKNSK